MSRVLLIEPNRPLRCFIAGVLADLGHDVLQCRSLCDTRDLLKGDTFDIVATDLVLDKRLGNLAADAAGDFRVVTLSGCPVIPPGGVDEGLDPLHVKPFRFDDLQQLVTAVAAFGVPAQLAA